ncbi:hypothetical protein BUE63_06055 [Bacillus sp. MB353a]|uniref:non-ribosomal peptide synthetase n=1 Tax=Bacillus TaxID=1386 RepID=UPI000B532E22|nr:MULTISPECIES: non-ribosomal peptide synthetase [Bacillus]MDD0821156.1 non-ribosomal peptide synthetase [Bacillus cereus]OWW11052.1 hypothetical protein BUE63_06055 [Bacillus sp. MB353a]
MKTIQDIFNKQIQIMDDQLEMIKNMTGAVELYTVNDGTYQNERKKLQVPNEKLNINKQTKIEKNNYNSGTAANTVVLESDIITPIDSNYTQIFPMSNIQKRLYAQSLVSESDPNTIVSVLTFKGELDIPKLEKAIFEIIQRHESLRTRFYVEEGSFKQEVLQHVDFKIEKIKKNDESIDELIQKSITPFDLSVAPLFKVTVIDIADNTGLLIFNFHHTVVDGISINIFVQELIQLFMGQSLLPVTKQYRNFIEQENRYLCSKELERNKEYWFDKLSGDRTVLYLPTDFPANKEGNFLADTVKEKLNSDMVNHLKNAAGKQQCSLFMLLVAAFNILLKKLSGNEDILIGAPASNRAAGSFDTSIGMFTNTIVLRNSLSDNKSLKEFIAEVRENCLESYSHLYYPFYNLINHFNNENLINAMIIYEKSDQRALKINDLEIKAYDFKKQYSDFDFTLEILEENGSFDINLTYKTSLFKEETIKRWGQYFKNILAVFLQDDNYQMKLGEIELIDLDEKNKLLYEFNENYGCLKHEAKTICQLFEAQAKKTPDNTAVVFEKYNMSYRELNEKANQLARLLQEREVGPETIVGIMVDRSLDMIIGILAVLKVGGAYLPIDADYPKERIHYMLKDSGCNIMLTQKALQEKFECPIYQISMDEENLENREKENLGIKICPQSLAYVIYTSGSTGKPKGVMVEHRNLISLVSALTHKMDFYESDRILCLATFSFDIFGFELFVPLTKGMQIYLLNNREQKDLLNLKEIIYRNQINILQVTPSRLKLIIDSIKNNNCDINYLQSLRAILIGGEELQFKVYDELRNITNAKIYNMYGPTEATIYATGKELTDSEPITIGKPLSNCRVFILDDKKTLLPIGVPGELYISGEAVGRGYLNKDELTSQKFEDNPIIPGERMYRTGDLARWTEDGNIQYLGRMDNQVKIRGHRIELGEIENQLLKDQRIKEVVVIDKKVRQEDKCLCAYVVFNEEMMLSELRNLVARALPDYMMPAYFIRMEKLPHTLNGKIDRLSLPDPSEEAKTEAEYEAPCNETEEILLDIWMKTLSLKKVGINDDFFSLGGDSIKAIQLASRLKAKGFTLDVEKIYKYPTVKQLAKIAVSNRKTSQETVTGKVSLTPIQRWFFEEGIKDYKGCSQSAIIYKEDGIQPNLIKKVFDKVMIHHDALRIVYKSYGGKVLQINRELEGKLYDWNVYNNLAFEDMLVECKEIQDSMGLDSGPLVKLSLFKSESGDYLFIAIHYLLIDNRSWEILIDDLERGYIQAENGNEIKFGEKTASYKEWSNKLNEYADSYNITKQVEYWNDLGTVSIKKLPRDGSKMNSK